MILLNYQVFFDAVVAIACVAGLERTPIVSFFILAYKPYKLI